jgi:hypothetical protein
VPFSAFGFITGLSFADPDRCVEVEEEELLEILANSKNIFA